MSIWVYFFFHTPTNQSEYFFFKSKIEIVLVWVWSFCYIFNLATVQFEFDKFKFKTWKSLDPRKSHVGVSESFWIWQIQNLKNTMICEQTFTWLGHFKKILNHAFISWMFTYIYKLSSDRPSQLKIVILHIKRYIKDI